MASTINSTSVGSGGLVSTGDDSGQLELQTDGTTRVVIDSSGNVTIQGQGDLRLADSDSSHYVALQSAGTMASNVTFTLPSADGTSGQVIQTNGSGTLSFATPASGALVYISTQTASNSATINFTGISSTYDVYAIEIVKALPATDGVVLRMRTSTNNGSSYDSGASDYQYIQSIGVFAGSYASGNTVATDSFIRISYLLGNAANELGFNGWVYLWKPSDATYFSVSYSGNGVDDAGQIFVVDQGMGQRQTAADVDAVRFLMSSGNISSGTFRLYGVANS